MKFSVLALDYDGTIARDSKTHVTIADAIRDARRQGIVLVLVTGRVLSDLRWLLNGQDLFDVIVAENGAVIEYSNGRTRKFGGPPPQEFLLPQGITKAIGFVFTDQARPVSLPARTLEQFVTGVELLLPIATIDGHAKRGDFSRWIGEVFGDQPLAVQSDRLKSNTVSAMSQSWRNSSLGLFANVTN